MFHLHVGGYLEGEFEWRRSDEDSKMKLHQMEGTQNQKHLKKGRKPINVASWPRPLSTGIWKCTSALHTASIMKLKVKVICWNIEKMQIENRKVFYMQTWLMLKWKIHVHFLGKTNSFADTENNLFTNAHLKNMLKFHYFPQSLYWGVIIGFGYISENKISKNNYSSLVGSKVLKYLLFR